MTDKLIETKGKLIKQGDVFEKHDKGLSITCGIDGVWLNDEETELLAYWISKNFDLSFLPGFKEALEYRTKIQECEKYKEIALDNVDRMKELTDMIKRLTNVLEGVMEADELKNGGLSAEAISQIQGAINDANKIDD